MIYDNIFQRKVTIIPIKVMMKAKVLAAATEETEDFDETVCETLEDDEDEDTAVLFTVEVFSSFCNVKAVK